jgi:hypothetical protein
MMALFLATVLVAASAAPEPALVAAIRASIDQVRARQAVLPPPRDDAERLIRLGELDQAPRRVIMAYDFSLIPADRRQTAIDEASALIEAVDHEDQAALLKLVPPEGWFMRSKYGDQAASAAFHIVQHADLPLQQRFLPVIEPLVATGEIDGQSYAMMFDRVAISQGRPQRYGTQFRCDGGKWRPYPIEDPARLDRRRQGEAIPGTFAQELAHFEQLPTCPQTRMPPPAGMKLK